MKCNICQKVSMPPKSQDDPFRDVSGLATVTLTYPKHTGIKSLSFDICNECAHGFIQILEQYKRFKLEK